PRLLVGLETSIDELEPLDAGFDPPRFPGGAEGNKEARTNLVERALGKEAHHGDFPSLACPDMNPDCLKSINVDFPLPRPQADRVRPLAFLLHVPLLYPGSLFHGIVIGPRKQASSVFLLIGSRRDFEPIVSSSRLRHGGHRIDL